MKLVDPHRLTVDLAGHSNLEWFAIRAIIDAQPDASQPLREMIRRLANELSNATDPIVSLCLDKEECRSLVYEARALLKESDHA